MKLPKIDANVPTEKLSLNLKAPTLETLDQYRAFYKHTYGQEVTRKDLLEQILISFMQEDKEFKKFQANG